ncbi:MAG: hypothetical protein M1817_005735 [Caeruleum heppii]|nr:MAG: hypothetical protein M1817_005735 [Caeruleum heppii]
MSPSLSPSSSPSTSPHPPPQTHKRSLSASLFSRLSFLRSSTSLDTSSPSASSPATSPTSQLPSSPSPSSSSEDDDDHHHHHPRRAPHDTAEESERRHGHKSSMADAVSSSKPRRRKGSLRKTALLGTGKLRLERRGSSTLDPFKMPSNTVHHSHQSTTRRTPSFRPDESLSTWDDSDIKTPTATRPGTLPRVLDTLTSTSPLHSPPLTSPTHLGPSASTTDDEDLLTLKPHPSSTSSNTSPSPSYFPAISLPHPKPHLPPSPLSPSHSHPSPSSPSIASPAVDYPTDTTPLYGYLILLLTWLTFVIGMGSVLDIWSWAWDVGVTPTAPPELENDESLPIVGYYPALLVLTGAVMSWVWVVAAWVGMKYFRHAKMAGGGDVG